MNQLPLTAAPALPSIPGPICWIGLNPSTAQDRDESGKWINDPTITREMRYCERWGVAPMLSAIGYRASADEARRYTLVRPGMVKANLFSLRSTDPRGLLREPLTPGDIEADINAVTEAADDAGTIVCAWGGPYAPRALANHVWVRARSVVSMLRKMDKPLHVLALTKDGHPRHPLYLKGALRPVIWRTP